MIKQRYSRIYKGVFSLVLTLALAGLCSAAEVLFIVADTTPNNGSGEAAVLDRLQNTLGHNVTLVTGSASQASDADGKDLVLISSKFSSANINSKFRDVTKPIITWESYAYDDMQITFNSGDRAGNQTQISITNAGHPLAAGYSGNVTITSSGEDMAYGSGIDAANVIATQVGNTSRAVFFVYEIGEMMAGGLSAPGLRIGLFLYDDTADSLNSAGWTLFDNAVDYALPPPMPAVGAAERLRPVKEPMGPSSHRSDLVISEIMYHPADRLDDLEGEFIELFNAGRTPIDLSGWSLGGEVEFSFPDLVIAEQTYVLIAKNPTEAESIYGLTGVQGPYSGKLSNGGGELRLQDAIGGVMFEVEYGDQYPWPAAADGAGHSLVLRRPSYGGEHPYAWEASDTMGGSPGVLDMDVVASNEYVVINEVLAHTDLPQIDSIELYNHGVTNVDLAGYVLTDNVASNKYIFPATVLPPGGFLVVDQTQAGFSLSAAGESVYLICPADNKVIDAWSFGAQVNGVSLGRYPDGGRRIAVLESNTFGAANARARTEDVVINEIMFNPITGDENDDYIELYNRSTSPVNLSHWRFTSGIDYVFASNTTVSANGYLVLAKNAAHLIAKYSALDASNCLGGFDGNLSNAGELLVLSRPDDLDLPDQDFVVVDEVDYGSGGRWGKWSDQGGSSLELRDADSDNSYASNWGDSDESGKASWTTVSGQGVLENGFSGTTPDEIHLYLLGEGEALVDDVSVKEVSGGTPGANKIGNSNFNGNLNNWIIQGNHIDSFRNTTEGFSGASLQLVAESRGDNSVNKAEYNLSGGLANGDTALLEAKVRWLRGYPLFMMRLHGNFYSVAQKLDVPDELGSPGLVNSLATNAAPAIHHVLHYPPVPVGQQDVVVQVQADDADGLGALDMVYRYEPSLATTTIPLLDDGSGNDALANDGLFTATLPGASAGTRAVFYISSQDGAGNISRFPEGGTDHCIVRFGSNQTLGDFPTYQFWLTDSDVNAWASAQGLGNARYDSTFVYEGSRVIYNARGRFRSSPFNRPDIGHPVTSGESPKYNWKFPSDDELQGGGTLILNGQVDASGVGEKVTFEFAKKMKLPASHTRLCSYYINGVKQGPLYLDIQQVDRNFISSYYGDNNDGDFFKLRDWHEFNDNAEVDMLGRSHADLEDWTRASTGALDKDRYRFHMARRSPRKAEDDYTNLFELVAALNLPVGQSYRNGVEALADVENWMRHFASRHATGDWDAFGFQRGKNCLMYQPEGGKWQFIPWDFERSFDVLSTVATNNDLKDTISSVISQMYNYTPFERMYYNVLYETAMVAMDPAYFNALVDDNYDAVVASGASSSTSITGDMKTWVAGRRAYILGQLSAQSSVPFEITTNGGNDLTLSTPSVTLEGNAPIGVFNILVNGIGYPITWMGNTSWSVDVPLAPGPNLLVFEGTDSDGEVMAAHTDSINVRYFAVGSLPAVTLNEWLADNATVNADPADGDFEDWLELYNDEAGPVDLSGWYLSDDPLVPTKWQFPTNTTIAAGEWLMIWADNEVLQTNGLHAGFSLNDAGDEIYLLNERGLLIDTVKFGFQQEDLTEGRFVDGSSNIITLAPTPESENQKIVINVPPVITPVANQNASEGLLFSLPILASDSNAPPQILSYSFSGAVPSGASINPTNGWVSWVPSELQGGNVYTVTVEVADNYVPVAATQTTFSISVAEVNLKPGLLAVGDKQMDEETLLTFVMQANDADLPEQDLTFSMVSGAPTGAVIGATNGVFSWTPSELQGPATFDVTVRVTDAGTPPMEDLESFQVVVREVNQDPSLVPIGLIRMHAPGVVAVQAAVSDVDLPVQPISYELFNQPSNMSVNATSGVIRIETSLPDVGKFWIPTLSVTDSEATVSDVFIVQTFPSITQKIAHTNATLCSLEWNSIPGETYDLEYLADALTADWQLQESVLASESKTCVSVSSASANNRIYRVVWRP